MRYRDALFLGAVLLAASAHATDAVLTDEDRATLELRGKYGEVDSKAFARAREFGLAENLVALDYLRAAKTIYLANITLLNAYSGGFRTAPKATTEANAAYQQRVVSAFSGSSYASVMLTGVRNIDDARLWDLIYADVEALAKRRAMRRNHCRIEVASMERAPRQSQEYGGYAFGGNITATKPALRKSQIASRDATVTVRWKYVCAGAPVDDPLTDLDGEARVPAPTPQPAALTYLERRDLASLGSIARTTLPDVEKRLGPLLADLSIPPPVSWDAVGGRPDDVAFPPLEVPMAILQLLKDRRSSPGAPVLSAILTRCEPDAAARYPREQAAIRLLLDLATLDHSRQANELIAQWLPIVVVNTTLTEREYRLRELLAPLASALPPDQVDLAKVKRTVLEQLPYQELREPTRLFNEAEADGRSLREPSAASLARWKARPNGAAQVAYLLAHGAGPNATSP
jgi:hypothetical protein